MSDRRAFIKSGAAALGALSLAPRHVLGRPRRPAHVTGYGALQSSTPRALEILILGGTGFLASRWNVVTRSHSSTAAAPCPGCSFRTSTTSSDFWEIEKPI
jgi:hypothetical protein